VDLVQYREDKGDSEARAMHGLLGRTYGSIAEGLSFQGDRDFRPLPCFGIIEKHYRKRREYSDISIYMNRLRSIVCSHDCPPLPALPTGAGQASLTTSKTAPHDSKTAPTDSGTP
jgi:hypothetical protein